MMQPQISRAEKNFIYHFGNVMEKLKSAYMHLNPEGGSTAFNTIWQGVLLSSVDADSVRKNCLAVGQMKTLDLILLACAYAAHAGREYRDNRQEIAWTYLMEAQYFAGGAIYAKALQVAWPEIEQVSGQTAVLSTKSKGGMAKNAGWKKIEDEAVGLIKILGEQGQRWRNERQMAIAIKPNLWPIALRENPAVSEKRYVQTISDRLKKRFSEIGVYLNK